VQASGGGDDATADGPGEQRDEEGETPSSANPWEGAYDEDEDDPIDMGESRISPVSAARELASALLADTEIGVTTADADAVGTARAAAGVQDPAEPGQMSDASRATKVARSKRRAKQRAGSTEDAQDAADLVARARASRVAASTLMASGMDHCWLCPSRQSCGFRALTRWLYRVFPGAPP
jgi:hypothetical protein